MLRPNWFFAFPLDGGFVRDLPKLPPALRLYHPDDVHLTLSFLGGCGEAAARRALEALDGALSAAPIRSVDVTLAKVVAMGPPSRYSALSALLGAGRRQTEAHIAALRDVLSEAALGKRESREPKAHVTIARPQRQASEARRREGLAWARSLNLEHVHARLDRLALYTWSEDRTERLFRVVAERALPP